MFRKTYLILVILFFASPLNAENITYGNVEAITFEFQGLRFGQSPLADMICIKGVCPSGQQGKFVKSKSIISTYKKQKDITHYNLIEISAPKYDFWENRFARVIFEMACDPETAEMCIDAVCDNLDSQYGLTWLDEVIGNTSPNNAFKVNFYMTNSGEIVEIHRYKRQGKWAYPFVRIYNKDFMDEIRIAANPKYVPVVINR